MPDITHHERLFLDELIRRGGHLSIRNSERKATRAKLWDAGLIDERSILGNRGARWCRITDKGRAAMAAGMEGDQGT